MSTNRLTEELQQLHQELTSALAGSGEQILDSSRAQLEELSKQLREALSAISDTLVQEEHRAERVIADRPLVAVGSALALGLVIGLALRRA